MGPWERADVGPFGGEISAIGRTIRALTPRAALPVWTGGRTLSAVSAPAPSLVELRGDRSAVRVSKAVDGLLRLHARRRAFKRGTVVVSDGDRSPGLWCVETGAIAVVGRSLFQREFIFRFRSPGEWFGETTLLDGIPWLYDHVASVKSTLLHIPHREAKHLVETNAEVQRELVRITCARLRATAKYVEELIVPDLPARLAYHLLVIARESANRVPLGRPLEVNLTQAVLASLLGATREAVGRHLVRWRDVGWVGLRYRRVSILDPRALEAVACGEPAPPAAPARKALIRA
jgi:CRP-like cAMP-binding protein